MNGGAKASFYIFVILIFLGVAALVAHDWLVLAIQISLGAMAGGIVLFVLFLLRHQIILSMERLRSARAQRIENEFKATTMIVTARPGEQVYVRELQPGGVWRALHLDPRLLIAGYDNAVVGAEDTQRWVYYQGAHAQRRAALAGSAAGPVNGGSLGLGPGVNLLEYMGQVERGLIVGNSKAGKTNLMQWLARERLGRSEHVFVIDPHAAADTWPSGVQVVGAGNQFPEVMRALQQFVYTMDGRYAEIAAGKFGHREHPLWTVLVDEWMSIEEQVPGAAEHLSRLLREARKASIDLFVGSHSRTVKALGLKGADERDGFAIVILHYDQFRDRREAIIEIPALDGKTERIPAILPPAFGGWTVETPAELPEPVEFDEVEPTEEERLILEMHAAGRSYREISEARWGMGKFGSYYNQQIEECLRRWGQRMGNE